MKEDTKKSKNKASPLKQILLIGVAFFIGWMVVQPLKSHAATSAILSVAAPFAFVPPSLIMVAALVVTFSILLGFGEKIVRFLAHRLDDRIEQRRERLARKNQSKQVEFDKKVEWRDINSWQGMPREVMKAERLLADQEKQNSKQKKQGAANQPIKGYPVLKIKKGIAKHYAQINDLSSTIEHSLLNEKGIKRAADLNELANRVLASLQSLYELGQIDSFVILEPDANGNKEIASYTHADRAEIKLSEINDALRAIVIEEATKISNDIDSIALPKQGVLFVELEKLKNEGERLLKIVKSQNTSVSSESIFVLEKITEERLDDLWDDYNNAKESMFEKSYDPLNLTGSTVRTSQNPDDIISEVFGDIRAIYKEVENSIRTSKESTAINKLLITKNYFNKR
jgi:hypothetical protein